MSSNIIVGLDIGTSTIRTVICKASSTGHTPEVIAYSDTPAFGLRHGYITNHQDAVKSIRRSIKSAEKMLMVFLLKSFFGCRWYWVIKFCFNWCNNDYKS